MDVNEDWLTVEDMIFGIAGKGIHGKIEVGEAQRWNGSAELVA